MADTRIHMVLLHRAVAPEMQMMSILQDQYTGREMLDLLIYVAEDVIMAHRCLVAAYMKKASIKQGKAVCMYKLHLPKTSRDVVKSLLGLVYFGILECNLYQVAQVQLAAKQLGFSEAEEACRRYLEAVGEAADVTSSMHPAPAIKQEPQDIASVPILQASEPPQDSQEKVIYVETGSAYEEGTTNMIKIPDSNEFIVFPTKPVVRHCVNLGNRPCHAEGMQDNQQSDATQPRPVLLCRNKYQLSEDN